MGNDLSSQPDIYPITYNESSLFVYGDANGDMSITPVDSAILSRYLSNWNGYRHSDYNIKSCDLDLNGKVAIVDNFILARHLAGWMGYTDIPLI